MITPKYALELWVSSKLSINLDSCEEHKCICPYIQTHILQENSCLEWSCSLVTQKLRLSDLLAKSDVDKQQHSLFLLKLMWFWNNKDGKTKPKSSFAHLLPQQGSGVALQASAFKCLHLLYYLTVVALFLVVLGNSKHHKHVGCKSKCTSICSIASLVGMLPYLEL